MFLMFNVNEDIEIIQYINNSKFLLHCVIKHKKWEKQTNKKRYRNVYLTGRKSYFLLQWCNGYLCVYRKLYQNRGYRKI